ncbi:ComEC/Rec2 family competence protein [Clostridium sp.]|uniref:ComEC/Rec2 family competence protein n=1 Tax=Clostridium sp. TaxID=1506 RepID=UPI0026332846|nr:ComEC/Rec2 family competence protein [Clostridium sp.]
MFRRKKLFPILIIFILGILLISNKILQLKKSSLDISNKMLVHFIDVDQGDSILVQVNNKNLLIDSGPSYAKENLFNYLRSINIKTFDYIIATHPHEDHIGNMSSIINNYKVLNFYSPKATSNTKAFETMVESLSRKNLKINVIKANINSIDLGKNTKVEFFSPNNSTYENTNNYSPIFKITYGKTSFLFTGDAEELIESEVINNNYNLKSDLLKVGHHGSSTSTSKRFFQKVNPKISIISVGENNIYNHPKEDVLSTINTSKILRTDLEGTILITSDGLSLK